MDRNTVLLSVVLVITPLSVSAASWWDTGKELLGGNTGNTTEPAAPVSGLAGLSSDEIAAGLKEALRVGAGNVVSQLGTQDGFYLDDAIHIPLPPQLQQAKGVLERVGMGASLQELEMKLNRAAEAATPRAKTMFLDAISAMTIDDAKKIYSGSEDAATRYFSDKMRGPLAEEMRPVIEASLAEVGALQTYDAIVSKYKTLPFVPDLKADLTDYTINGGMDGIFYYLAREEAAIRENPVKQTTSLLKKLFGQP